MIRSILVRDFRLASRRWGAYVTPLVFIAVVASLFPLAVAPEPDVLRVLGIAVVWVTALLASLLALESLFQSDVDDGVLDQLVIWRGSLLAVAYARAFSHWLLTGLPIVLFAPLVAVSYDLPLRVLPVLVGLLTLASLSISILGAICASLTVNARSSGGLLAILVLPLCCPILIFGALATDLALHSEHVLGPLLLLASIAVMTWTLGPIVIAAALRVAVES